MTAITITESDIDHIVKASHEIFTGKDEIRTEEFLAELKTLVPATDSLGMWQISYALQAYYDFTAGNVVRRRLDEHDSAIMEILAPEDK